MVIIKDFNKSKYRLLFDQKSGILIRKGYADIDPLFNIETPELLDISITNYCTKSCSYCYRQSNKLGKHMSLMDYEKIISQASKMGVLQVAIGGGNPNQHPYFTEILKLTRQYNIIPSYTTNGIGLTEDILEHSKIYCGAVAVSWHNDEKLIEGAINLLKRYEIKSNIHFILSSHSINKAIELLKNNYFSDINAVVFLNYKPYDLEVESNLNNAPIESLKEFFNIISNTTIKVGFDSCCLSFLLKYSNNIAIESIEPCEAGKFSAFISEDLKMYPCSFMITHSQGANLIEKTISDVWQNEEAFMNIRNKKHGCDCNYLSICNGGCTLYSINAPGC